MWLREKVASTASGFPFCLDNLLGAPRRIKEVESSEEFPPPGGKREERRGGEESD